MTDRIGVIGSGLLRDAISMALRGSATSISATGQSGRKATELPVTMLLTASDAWDMSAHPAVRRHATAHAVPWLPIWTELGHAFIGPMEIPGEVGCGECAATRRRQANVESAERAALLARHGAELEGRASSRLTGLAADLIGTVVAEEVERWTIRADPRTKWAFLRLDLARLSMERHAFLPDKGCDICGTRENDAQDKARIRLSPATMSAPGSFRVRTVDDELDDLADIYVDEQTGVIPSLRSWSDGGLVVTAADLATRNGRRATGYGRAAQFGASRRIALLEALERYGAAPHDRRTAVVASYAELGDRALDPRTLGLYPPGRYDQPGFRFKPFSPDQEYRWVWGWSFLREQPVLVPESVAYYDLAHHHRDGHALVFEISNGCALGGCLEEAILYGLLEVAERDAFLLTWYARLPAPRIDLAEAGTAVRLLAATIQAETGLQVDVFDITVEQGIPSVWAMARAHAGEWPAVTCAAGSHPDPERAVMNALAELGPGVTSLVRRCQDEGERARARRMTADPELVRAMEDHALLYADPAAAARLEFLGSGSPTVPPVRTLREVGAADRGGFASSDLRDVALEAIRRYTDRDLDVVIVDQTAPEHRAGGFRCVKVLIPGTLSMTFGHRHRRTHDLPRLLRVPQQLGFRSLPLPLEDVNPHPHPFL